MPFLICVVKLLQHIYKIESLHFEFSIQIEFKNYTKTKTVQINVFDIHDVNQIKDSIFYNFSNVPHNSIII